MKEFTTMNNIKKTGLGIATAAAATVLVAGFATPAMASTTNGAPQAASSVSKATSISKTDTSSNTQLTQVQYNALRNITAGYTGGTTSNSSPVYIAPSVNVGDVASGDAIGSGNESALFSGNTYSVPVLSGNENALLNNDGNSNSLGSGNSTGNGDSAGNGNSAGNGDSSVVSPVTNGNGITGNTTKSSVSKIVNSVVKDSGNSTKSSSSSTSVSPSTLSNTSATIINNINETLGLGGHK
jgi:hypothetical protein